LSELIGSTSDGSADRSAALLIPRATPALQLLLLISGDAKLLPLMTGDAKLLPLMTGDAKLLLLMTGDASGLRQGERLSGVLERLLVGLRSPFCSTANAAAEPTVGLYCATVS
jgi:hypothetical protein